jgi:hypothetical protein
MKLIKLLLVVLFFAAVFPVAAQENNLGIANYYPVLSSEVKDGDIVSSGPSGINVTTIPYDPMVVGVVQMKPAVLFDVADTTGKYPVVALGTVAVNVTSDGGPIARGDLVTTSKIPGAGMKATEGGFVIGTALEDFAEADTTKVGKIHMTLNIHFYSAKTTVKSNLFNVFSLSSIATYQDPLTVLRYVIAAGVLILSTFLALTFFGQVASRGVDALGRNPLAARMIQVGIISNIFVTIIIIASGLGLAVVIIKL